MYMKRTIFSAGIVLFVAATICLAWDCPKCKETNPDGGKFCGECGTKKPAPKPPAATGWKCPKCKQVNPNTADFCGRCGVKVLWKCPQCGEGNAPSSKFCGKCGLQKGKRPKPGGGDKPGGENKPPPVDRPGKPKPSKGSRKTLDERIDEAIAKGVEYLWDQQKSDGRWEQFNQDVGINGRLVKGYFKYPAGNSAIAAYALLESGVSPQNERMAKALEWLGRQSITKTYSLALRASAWEAANRTTDGKYRDRLVKDARTLMNSTNNGAYGYDVRGKPDKKEITDHSNSQYAVLGMWAAQRDTGEIPIKYWQVVMDYWAKKQKADGSWDYGRSMGHANTPRASMTAAGIATMFVCKDNLAGSRYATCRGQTEEDTKSIKAGLEWFEKNFEESLKRVSTWWWYYLYCMERVGLASGYKYFGTANWFQTGARMLLSQQRDNGRWGNGVSDTAFAVLFLVRGRHPVLFNKLEFDGDWNNRPRDMASLTRWISNSFEKTVNWQIINLRTDVTEWHDAPILYISGAKAPKFTDPDIAKLREFVWQGGTIFSATECGGTLFRKGMLDAYRKMFPTYEMVPLPKTHEIYSAHFKLTGMPRMSAISNGIRPLVIHTDVDVPKSWQMRMWKTQKWAFESAANLYLYLTDGGTLRHRGVSHWPAKPKGSPSRTVRIVRLKHAGNFDPEPLAYERFRRLMLRDTGVDLDIGEPIEISEIAADKARIAVMTGTGDFKLTDDQRAALKAFVVGGGTLVIDAAGGPKFKIDPTTKTNKPTGFAAAAEREIEAMFGEAPLRRLASEAAVYSLPGYEIKDVRYRRRTRARMATTKTPSLRAVTIDNRPGVIYSREDLTAGLVGYAATGVDGYEPDWAYALLRNILLSAAAK
jgi:hypothetical protein